ncbi:hypothetical protein [uncultured Roseobacter sp.]|uniref:hypothetical protein n=1 Tax=uncultured Roseobacter sp. TaxID=114847 RepID=UPI00262548D1|nr:hypothetical protein [uncultured Roseobacter sp.]
MRSYEAARNLFSFLAFFATCVIILGVIVGILGATAASTGFQSGPNGLQALLGAIPGAAITLAGFYGLVMVQMGRASVDSAELAQQSLEVSRQQLEVSREVLAQGKATAASYAALLKRQPSMKAQPSDASDSSPAETSYGARPEPMGSIAELDVGAQSAALANEKANSPAQLENMPAMKADDILPQKQDPSAVEQSSTEAAGSDSPTRKKARPTGTPLVKFSGV